MAKKAKAKQVKAIFKMLAQSRPAEERDYILGLMRSIVSRQKKIKHWVKNCE